MTKLFFELSAGGIEEVIPSYSSGIGREEADPVETGEDAAAFGFGGEMADFVHAGG